MTAARTQKNKTLDLIQENGSVEALANMNVDEVKTVGVVTETTETNEQATSTAQEKLDSIKAEMQQIKKKAKNKSMTFLISPENAKRLATLNVKGQKSELVNKLLDMYFKEN